jgi:hypothetical protein
MAIAFDAATDGGHNGGGGTLTFNHTCTGSDRFLVVSFTGDVGGGSDDISAVTFNGDALTFIGKRIDATIARMGYCYGMVAPDAGTFSVSISTSGSHFLTGGATSYTGVLQTGQPEVTQTFFSDADADSSVTNAITPATADSWVILSTHGYDFSNNPPTAGAGATRRTYDPSFGLWGLMDSNGPQPASSYSMTWTYAATGGDMGSIMFSLAPAGGGGGGFDPASGGWGPEFPERIPRKGGMIPSGTTKVNRISSYVEYQRRLREGRLTPREIERLKRAA